MNDHIGEMMPSWPLQAVELAVEHMRQPRQWMPVANMALRECPNDAVGRKALGHIGIFRHVGLIVECDEIESRGLAEDRGHCQNYQSAGDRDLPTLCAAASGR